MTNWLSPNPFRQGNPKWKQEPPQRSRLMERDGYLFVLVEYAIDEPGVINQYWYPIGIRSGDFSRNYYDKGVPPEGIPVTSTYGDAGEYSVDLGGYRPLRFRLAEGEKTKPTSFEKRVVPPPKVRKTVELRWSGTWGIWEKASKSTRWKWVPA